jgi:23S rRNA pseudouridine2605 synthase
VRVRLQKLLAGAGIASRRQCETLVREGRVTVNGRVAQVGDSADPTTDRVAVDGEGVHAERAEYWVVHKPTGVLTTRSDPEGRPTVLGLLPPAARRRRLFPVGRLDRDSEGLVLLTNDGDLAHRMLHPAWGSEKEYRVTVRGRASAETLEQLAAGIRLREGRTAPAQISGRRHDPKRDATSFRIVLREGRNRQIRRACAQLGHRVLKLLRVRVGPLELGELRGGEGRVLRGVELRALLEHAAALEASAPARRRRKSPRPGTRSRPAGASRDSASKRGKRTSPARLESPK